MEECVDLSSELRRRIFKCPVEEAAIWWWQPIIVYSSRQKYKFSSLSVAFSGLLVTYPCLNFCLSFTIFNLWNWFGYGFYFAIITSISLEIKKSKNYRSDATYKITCLHSHSLSHNLLILHSSNLTLFQSYTLPNYSVLILLSSNVQFYTLLILHSSNLTLFQSTLFLSNSLPIIHSSNLTLFQSYIPPILHSYILTL